jgi:hypothetical protein
VSFSLTEVRFAQVAVPDASAVSGRDRAGRHLIGGGAEPPVRQVVVPTRAVRTPVLCDSHARALRCSAAARIGAPLLHRRSIVLRSGRRLLAA